MNKAVIDTSSLLYAWHEYPINKFPKVWGCLDRLIMVGNIIIFEVVKSEIEREKSLDLHNWLSKHKTHTEPDEIGEKAEKIKESLEITHNKYGRGVKLNDILIIAFAAIEGLEVITNERVQKISSTGTPPQKRNYKIPRVCKQERIHSYNFLTFLKNGQKVFQANSHCP